MSKKALTVLIVIAVIVVLVVVGVVIHHALKPDMPMTSSTPAVSSSASTSPGSILTRRDNDDLSNVIMI